MKPMLYFTLFFVSRFGFCQIVYCYDLQMGFVLCCVVLPLCNLTSWKAPFSAPNLVVLCIFICRPFTAFSLHSLRDSYTHHCFFKTHTCSISGSSAFEFPALYFVHKRSLSGFTVLIHFGFRFFFFLFLGCGNIDFWWNSFSFPSKSKR